MMVDRVGSTGDVTKAHPATIKHRSDGTRNPKNASCGWRIAEGEPSLIGVTKYAKKKKDAKNPRVHPMKNCSIVSLMMTSLATHAASAIGCGAMQNDAFLFLSALCSLRYEA